MNNNLSNEEFVNRYMDNELSEIDRLNFENKLLHDPDLREEYNLQSELINGIKEARRQELKNRLIQIPIQTPIYQTIGFKALTIAGIAGIGIGVYFLSGKTENIQLTPNDISQNQISISKNNIPEIPKSIEPSIEKEIAQEPTINHTSKNSAPAEIKTKRNNTASTKTVTKKTNVVDPNVVQPEIVSSFESEEIVGVDVNPNQLNRLNEIKEDVGSTVEISTIKDRKNKFHYKFYENKLFLLGNFNDMPYEILELHASDGKSYFLYYNDNFYRLNSSQEKPMPLVKIENDSLINELKVIQTNQHQ